MAQKNGKNEGKNRLVRIYTERHNNERVGPIKRYLSLKYDKDFNQEMTYNEAIKIGLQKLEEEAKLTP